MGGFLALFGAFWHVLPQIDRLTGLNQTVFSG
jgi:hypothetical protein